MASHVDLFVHLVCAVDHRRPLLAPPIQRPVHAWIGGKCRDLGYCLHARTAPSPLERAWQA